MCAAATHMAAPFCARIEDWQDLNDVSRVCLQAEVSVNTMLGFLNLEHFDQICNYPEQLEALCAAVDVDDDMATCQLGLDIENGASERRELRRRCPCGCLDELTVVQTRQGEKYMRDVFAGEEVLTCEAGVYTRVFANVNHHDKEPLPFVLLETNTSSLTLTRSHFVLSNGQYVRAGDMKVGSDMDGEEITRISAALGRRRDLVALRQDIMVNGICGTWVDSSFAAILYMDPLNRLMNPVAAYYPKFTFSATQKIADVVVPLIDSQLLSWTLAAPIMITVSLTLAAGNLAALLGFAWFFYCPMKQ